MRAAAALAVVALVLAALVMALATDADVLPETPDPSRSVAAAPGRAAPRARAATSTPAVPPRAAPERAAAAPPTSREDLRAALLAAYAAIPRGRLPRIEPEPADVDEILGRRGLDGEIAVRLAATDLDIRVRQRTQHGRMHVGPAAMEIAATGECIAQFGSTAPDGARIDDVDPYARPRLYARNAWATAGPVPDAGVVFVIERIHVSGSFGDTGGTIRIGLPRDVEDVALPGAVPRLTAVLRGRAVVPISAIGELSLTVDRAAARVRFEGRGVPAADAPPPREFVAEPGAEGLLAPGHVRIVLQAAATWAHVPVRIDAFGRTRGPVRRSTSPVHPWDPPEAAEPAVFAEGSGVLPPGYLLRVTRVEWRATCSRDESSMSVEPGLNGRPIGSADGVTRTPAGVWTAGPDDLDVTSESADRLALVCTFHTTAEAIVHGRVQRR